MGPYERLSIDPPVGGSSYKQIRSNKKNNMWQVPAAQAGLSLLTSSINYAKGSRLKSKGDKLEGSLSRPNYDIPEYIGDNYKLAKKMADEGISNEEENAFLDNTFTNQANTIRKFRSRKAGMLGAEVVGKQTQDALRELRVADVRQKIENQREFMRQGQIMADYEDKQFQLNELDPYADSLNYARSMKSAGIQNMNNAMDGFTQSLASAGSGYFQSLNG